MPRFPAVNDVDVGVSLADAGGVDSSSGVSGISKKLGLITIASACASIKFDFNYTVHCTANAGTCREMWKERHR